MGSGAPSNAGVAATPLALSRDATAGTEQGASLTSESMAVTRQRSPNPEVGGLVNEALGGSSGSGANVSCGTVAEQMTEQIESTVMWVQQLLESVHFVDSDAMLDPGASLVSTVQPRLRHQKDEALMRSLKLFSEKKQEEKEFDVHAVFFRGEALKSVQALKREKLRQREGDTRDWASERSVGS